MVCANSMKITKLLSISISWRRFLNCHFRTYVDGVTLKSPDTNGLQVQIERFQLSVRHVRAGARLASYTKPNSIQGFFSAFCGRERNGRSRFSHARKRQRKSKRGERRGDVVADQSCSRPDMPDGELNQSCLHLQSVSVRRFEI